MYLILPQKAFAAFDISPVEVEPILDVRLIGGWRR
jgi:hypothetical protein